VSIKDNYNIGGVKYLKGAKIKLNAANNFSTQNESDSIKKISSKCPVDFTGDAVIRYYIKRKAYYYIVKNMLTLEQLEYP
jgi:hypothetical protein